MNLVQKARAVCILKRVLEISVETDVKSWKTPFRAAGSFNTAQNPRLYSTKRATKSNKVENSGGNPSNDANNGVRITPSIRKNAALAFLDYFYGTRGLQFMDAENMSKNAPCFLESFLKKVNIEADIGHSIARFLRYHPINEFEPFLESLGLEPTEYLLLLPRNKLFLNEDSLLLENHHVLCNYGIARKRIGKIYKEAIEVFKYDVGVLASKIQAYENLGFSHSFVSKMIVCSPRLLIGDTNMDFVKMLEILKSMGFGTSWVEENLSEDLSYNWCMMHRLLSLFREIGFNEDELSGLIRQHPGFFFENSGEMTLSLVGFQTKLGSSMSEICLLFQKFPRIEIGKFVSNLRHCFLFLNEIEMKVDEIGEIIRSHSLWLGTCRLKKTGSLLGHLNVGKKRLRQVVQENPHEMKKWVLGSKVEPLPDTGEEMKSKMMKTKFLLNLGYVENSKEMDKALRTFRGKGSELRERFDFLVKMGLNEKDVRDMVKASPQILGQSKDVLEAKVDYLVKKLDYPVSTLVKFPSFLNYTIPRVKLRFSLYTWLIGVGKAEPELAISTIVACSETYFVRAYVNRHPDGPKVWEDLKKQICSE